MQTIRIRASRPSAHALRFAAATLIALAAWISPTGALAQFDRSTGLPNQIGDLPGQGNSDPGRQDVATTPNPEGPAEFRQGPNSTDPRSLARNQLDVPVALPPYRPSEFERYIDNLGISQPGEPIRRFGSTLLTDTIPSLSGQDPLPSVPASYIIKPGDEIALTIWGAIDANLRLSVDRSGVVSVPRIGAINVGGLRYADLSDTIRRQVSQQFHDFQLTASIGQLRAIRVFVTGYAQRPGSITVSGLSSVLHAVMRAGGPSSSGSFRDIRLTRGGKQIAAYDLYDVLLKGDRGVDELVQPDDIIFIGPIGPQVAVVGSVNQQAIFELKPGEVLGDVLHMAGGFAAVADPSRVAIERLSDRLNDGVVELALPAHLHDPLSTGDIVWAYSSVAAVLPQDRQNKRVRVDGEVRRPGDYVLRPNSTVADALRAAGGLTSAAYPYGTEFTRRSVRKTQQANYERALRELETDMTKAEASQRVTTAEEATAKSASAAANARLLTQLRELQPTGRIVLEIQPDSTALPDLPLQDGDSITVPARDTTVGVFGSVFSTGSFLFRPHHTTEYYLHLAGGPTRTADKHSMFVIRANGSVVSAQQGSSFWHSGSEFADAEVEPGDSIFVPEELNQSTFTQDAKDWTQILYQFGLGIAGLNALNLR